MGAPATTTSPPPPAGAIELVGALLPYAARRRGGLVALLGTTLALAGLSVLKPWPMKLIVDNALLGQPLPEPAHRAASALPGAGTPSGLLAWCAGATLALFLLGWVARLGQAMAHVAFGQRMVYDLASDLFAHLQRLSLRFHHRKSVGDSIRRVTGDCGCVSAMIRDALLPVLASAVTLVVMVGIMWRLDPLLTLLAVAVMPPLVLVLRVFARPMIEASYRQEETEGRVYDEMEQTLCAIAAVQAFNRVDWHDEKFRARAGDTVAAAMTTTNVQLRFKILVGLCTALGTAAIIWVGGRHAIAGTLSAGTILVFLSYLASLYGPIETVMYSSFAVQSAAGSGRRVVEVLQTKRDVDDRPGAAALTSPVRGRLVFERVGFAYEPGRDVLHDLSLEVAPGETVAIVGPTGAGKSTLVALVPRFNDPSRGRVLLDGHDLRDVTLASLRRNVSLVLQDSFLFPLSVADNIAYGRPDATRDQVTAAARAANAHQFIMRLPQGYDTPVGERGATLSGGERQRIAIARALLRDAPLLILDEPTSNLDAATEQAVLDALRRLMSRPTTLVIAHRLSTVRHADRIVVIEGGRVVESGTHEQLVSRAGGAYARLYHRHEHAASADEGGAA